MSDRPGEHKGKGAAKEKMPPLSLCAKHEIHASFTTPFDKVATSARYYVANCSEAHAPWSLNVVYTPRILSKSPRRWCQRCFSQGINFWEGAKEDTNQV